jgi:hypothetical protein
MKKKLLLALFTLASAGLFAHAGHDHEVGVFDPPHGGAFTKMAGHYAEVYIKDGKLNFCLEEGDGDPADGDHNPKNIIVKVSPKGEKTVTLKLKAAEGGCAVWNFKTSSKLIKVEISAKVGGKTAKAKVTLESSAINSLSMPAGKAMDMTPTAQVTK